MCTGVVELGWWNGDAGRRMCQCQLILVLYTDDDDGTIYTEYYGTAAISISVSLLWSLLCLRPDLCVDRQKKRKGLATLIHAPLTQLRFPSGAP